MRRAAGTALTLAAIAATLTFVGVAPARAELDPIAPHADFVPLSPRRLLETRAGLETVDGRDAGRGVFASGERVALDVVGRAGVPAGTPSVMLNVTVTDPIAPGFLTVWPCDQARPLASNLNYAVGDTVANLAFVKLSALGQVCIYAHTATEVIVDLEGYTAELPQLRAVSPLRLLDTRAGESTVDGRFAGGGPLAADDVLALDVVSRHYVIPFDLAAVVVNLTVTESVGPGFVTVWPCGRARPLASNANVVAGQTVAALVITGVDASGRVCVSSSVATHVVLDVLGYASGGTTPVVTLVPARLLDTRAGLATTDGRFAGTGATTSGGVVELDVRGRGGVPADASVVALTVTATEPSADGFVTVWPCGAERPTASNLNHRRGQTIANAAVVRPDADGRVCLYTQASTHLVVDATSAWLPSEQPVAFEDLSWLTLPPDLVLATRAIETISPDGRFAALTGARANGGAFDAVLLIVDRVTRTLFVGPVFATGVADLESIGVVDAPWIDDEVREVLYRGSPGFMHRWAFVIDRTEDLPLDEDKCDIPAPRYYVTLIRLRSAPLEANTNCIPGVPNTGYFMVDDMSPSGRWLIDAPGIGQFATRLTDAKTQTFRPIPVRFRPGELPASCSLGASQLLDNGTAGIFAPCGDHALVRTVTADGFVTDRLQPLGPRSTLNPLSLQSGWFPSGRAYWWTEGDRGRLTLHVHDVATGADLPARAVGDCTYRAVGSVVWAVSCP